MATTQPTSRSAFVVDDDAQMRTLVSNLLGAAGIRTREFKSGPEVEVALAGELPGLIVLDLSLGDSDAVEVIRTLGTTRFGGAVLLISGHDLSTLQDVQAIGINRGLVMLPPLHKPFRADEMRERVALLDRSRPEPAVDLTLDSALKNGWLELWYQPKIDLKTKLMRGAEALIRLRHPEHGLVQPGSFLPRPGDALYYPLTEFVLRRALSDWLTFADHRMTSQLAINVPASVLQRPDFVATLRRHLPDHPQFPGLIVEITEDEALGDPELAREIAVQLKLYNVNVSIDDFGSGFSSLSRLKELPFAELKLDRSFVHGCADDARKRAMCEAVADLARRFKITSVAEGVETRDDLRVVSELGYDLAQGFYFAQPMRRPDFIALIEAKAATKPQGHQL